MMEDVKSGIETKGTNVSPMQDHIAELRNLCAVIQDSLDEPEIDALHLEQKCLEMFSLAHRLLASSNPAMNRARNRANSVITRS